MTLAQILLESEAALLKPATRHSRRSLESLLAPDFIEFTSSGRICSREQVIESLLGEASAAWQIHEFLVHTVSDSLALATYRTTRHDPHTGDPAHSLRCSLWQHTAGRWQLRFHQGTPVVP